MDKQNICKLNEINEKKSFTKLNNALGTISSILNSTLGIDDLLDFTLNELKGILEFDKALIMFLDGDNLTLKSSKNITNILRNQKILLPKGFSIVNNLIKNNKPVANNVCCINDETFINILNIDINYPCSYLACPLMIRGTLFGLIMLIKEKENFFTSEDEKIIDTYASCISYSVKDAELNSVFKMQLKALNDNVVERSTSLEIIKEQNHKIIEADKLKTEFLANISHELRTPLNAIIGFSEALKLKIFGDLNLKQEDYVDDIHSSGLHLLGMINDLLDLTKIEASEMRLNKINFAVNHSIQEVLNIVKALADQKKVFLEAVFCDEELNICADYQNFQQIMFNLLSNAIKFSHPNGEIQVITRKINENLLVSVKDNGIGIDQQFHKKIFEKFQQVDNSYTRKQGSTGLGLTITKKLIEMHEGTIWIESELNKGSNFSFTIPLKTDEPDGNNNV